jgi:hypothetical protein
MPDQMRPWALRSVSKSLSNSETGAIPMPLNKDLREFLALLNSNAVDYLVVGAFVVAFHAIAAPAQGILVNHRPTGVGWCLSAPDLTFFCSDTALSIE